MDEIRFIKHSEIDLKKWDETICNSYNGLVFGYSFFLNSMADNQWDALVMEDYKAVFPLVWRSKFGISYLYQPFFCQQLGVFSTEKISEKTINQFLEKIPRKFRYQNFHLNYENNFPITSQTVKRRTSFCIDLSASYSEIFSNYNADAKKNISKGLKLAFEYKKDIDLPIVVNCFFEAYGSYYPSNQQLKEKISDCSSQAIQFGKGFTRAIYDGAGALLCAGFFFFSNGRIHYSMAAPTPQGKKNKATHLLIDQVLKEFAGTSFIFDFEGSDLESVAFFYSKFGPVAKTYLEVRQNNLPWWCRFLKK